MPPETTPLSRRRLGRTEADVSAIGLGGAWLMGRRGDQPLTYGAETVRHALTRGVNYLDTAECYGESELAFGLALEGYEGDCFLATKFGHVPEDFDFSRESVLRSVERSRKRLRNRPIDLLQLHTPPEPAWESLLGEKGAFAGMREAQERGWCRFLGTTGRDVDFLRRCVETDLFDTLLVFLRYDLLDQSALPLLREAHSHDMGVILASPLRLGLFGSAREESLSSLSPEERIRFEALESLFANEEGGITAAAMRFALACPEASTVLSGVTSKADLDSVLALGESPLRPDLMEAVWEIART